MGTKQADLEVILSKLKKEELLQIVCDLAEDNQDVEKRLLFKYATSDNEISESRKLIQEFINQAKVSGFISWRRAYHATQGARMVLEKAENQISNDPLRAVSLSIVVLSKGVSMLQYCDDSNGDVGDIIRGSFPIIEESVLSAVNTLDAKEQKKVFDAIVKEAQNKRYDGWEDSRLELLELCVPFTKDDKHRKRLENQLEKELQKASESDYGSYRLEKAKVILYRILEDNGEKDKAREFVEDHIELTPFRKITLDRLLEERDYLGVIRISKEGAAQDQSYRGLVSDWREYELQAHEQLGNIVKQRELTKEFVVGGKFRYFSKLKGLYQPDEWEKVRAEVLKEVKGMSIYFDILIEEKLYEEMLNACKRKPYHITYLYPYLRDEYPEEVSELFRNHIKAAAEESNERRLYRKVCKIIKTYQEACGKSKAQELIQQLKTQHERRPAFVDELNKIK